MKIVSKFISWISGLLFLFFVVNLFFGYLQFKSINKYIDYLNSKNWETVVQDINIKNPKTILNLFYTTDTVSGDTQELSGQNNSDLPKETKSNNTLSGDNQSEGIDAYDPEFEDEFNSFFNDGEKNQNLNVQGNNQVEISTQTTGDQNIEEENIEEDNTIGNKLVEKFNE